MSLLTTLGGCAPRSGPGSTPESNSLIEKPAMAISSANPKPRSPTELLSSGDTARVRIRVLVDATGSADMGTVEVLSSPHAAYTREVMVVLPTYRFIPAEIQSGRPPVCRINSENRKICDPGRLPKKISQSVDMDFVFVPPAPP